MKRRGWMMVLALVSALLLSGPTAAAKKPAEGKKFQLGRVKQMQQEGRQKMLAMLTPRQRSQAAKGGGNVKQGGKKRGKKKAGRKKRAKR
ncbi:MAG: hypothetical protein IIA67_14335 [Planctomycetes bacterium]|nr:hypothetical protein [Planctomycetota bacterium]